MEAILNTTNPAAKAAKRFIKTLMGRTLGVKAGYRCDTDFLGSEYGGYCVCPSRLESKPLIYSFGVGEDVSFDLEMIRKYGARVFAFDPTEKSMRWIRSQSLPEGFRFLDYGLADFDGIAKFTAPENPEHVSYTMVGKGAVRTVDAKVFRMKTIMAELGHQRLDILKMDIEGAEYGALADILGTGIDIGQILVEFHHRMPQIGKRKTLDALKALEEHGFRLFYVSESEEEFSFIKPEERRP